MSHDNTSNSGASGFSLPEYPQGVGDVLDTSFRLLRTGVKYWIGWSLALNLLSFGVAEAYNWLLPPVARAGFPAVALGIGALHFLLMLFLGAALVYRFFCFSQGEVAGFGETAARAAKSLVPLILAGVMGLTAVMVGLVLLVYPGLVLAYGFSFTQVLIVAEREGPYRSLRHSYQLVSGNRSGVVYALTVAGVLVLVAQVGLGAVLAVIQALNHFDLRVFFLANAILSGVVGIFTQPFLAAVIVVKYFDVKLRKASPDLKARAALLA